MWILCATKILKSTLFQNPEGMVWALWTDTQRTHDNLPYIPEIRTEKKKNKSSVFGKTNDFFPPWESRNLYRPKQMLAQQMFGHKQICCREKT